MADALAVAQMSMVNDVERLANISFNLANVGTAGFKKQITVNHAFSDFLQMGKSGGIDNENFPAYRVTLPRVSVTTDQTAGTIKYTGNPLDVFVGDKGYFSVLTNQGVLYTKQGSFKLNPSGVLVNTSGHPVLGQAGEIYLSTPQPRIDDQGKIWEGDTLVGQLKVVEFADSTELISLGQGLYSVEDNPSFKEQGMPKVKQSYLEASNVVLMDEMVKMMETLRHFEASLQIVKGYDDMLDNSINIIGDL